jgi:hypothetical protein
MKRRFLPSALFVTALAMTSLLLAPAALSADGPKSAPAPGAGTATNSPASLTEIPLSLFVIPSTPKEGRNPFFPQSVLAAPAVKPKEATVDTGAIVLNGITSPPKRTAMINGRTFELGEEGEIRMPSGGKLLIKCEQIKDDSAIIVVSGIRRELRLRMGV